MCNSPFFDVIMLKQKGYGKCIAVALVFLFEVFTRIEVLVIVFVVSA